MWKGETLKRKPWDSLCSHCVCSLSFGVQMMTSLESGGVTLNQQAPQQVQEIVVQATNYFTSDIGDIIHFIQTIFKEATKSS